MANGQSQKSGAVGDAEISSEQVCVVYHAQTGDIFHVHRVVNLRGAKAPQASEIEARALELAHTLRPGSRPLQMKTLFVQPEDFAASAKVDLQSLKLIIR
jgi:hypothetical protein